MGGHAWRARRGSCRWPGSAVQPGSPSGCWWRSRCGPGWGSRGLNRASAASPRLAHVASFVGLFALAISIQGRALASRRTVYAVAAAIGVVTLFALLAPAPRAVPEIQAARFLDDVEARLNYPLDYWNALAATDRDRDPAGALGRDERPNPRRAGDRRRGASDDGADRVLHPLRSAPPRRPRSPPSSLLYPRPPRRRWCLRGSGPRS